MMKGMSTKNYRVLQFNSMLKSVMAQRIRERENKNKTCPINNLYAY